MAMLEEATTPRPLEEARALVTVPPYASFVREVASEPFVAGLRLNTVMPVRGPREETLARLLDAAMGKPIFLDLKARQLRVVGAAIPPFTEVRLSHRIRVRTPTLAYFSDGKEEARVVQVDGDRLILEDGPRRLVGPGESVNIPDPSLEVEELLTEGDLAWLEAARALSVRDVMLSFTESAADVAAVAALYPEARIVAKIESRKGLRAVDQGLAATARLMAARGDLYVEVGAPHEVLGATAAIIDADPEAIVASRILGSLARSPVPEAADLGDVAHLLALGYRTLMLGDEVCLRRDSVVGAIRLLEAIVQEEGAIARRRTRRRAHFGARVSAREVAAPEVGSGRAL